MSKLTHLTEQGQVSMVDVCAKPETIRTASALACVYVGHEVMVLLKEEKVKKGDVWAAVRIAGIQAAKKTSELIPLCHLLNLSSVTVDISIDEVMAHVNIQSTCRLTGRTGVEMEALTSVSVAALTLYDMCKSLNKAIVIKEIKLLEKTGGKSGDWVHDR